MSRDKWFHIFLPFDGSCESSKRSIELFKVYGRNFFERDIALSPELFENWNVKRTPIIFYEDKFLGGEEELKELLRIEQETRKRNHYRNKSRTLTQSRPKASRGRNNREGID